MKLVRASYQIEAVDGLGMVKKIEAAGRTCYKSEEKITETSAEHFVRRIIRRGHESVLEHASVTVRVICDRGVSHELVRHRIASFCQESTRYCDYADGDIAFVIPPWCRVPEGVIRDFSEYITEHDGGLADADLYWGLAMSLGESHYRNLREKGWTPEQARAVLPNSLKTEIVMTCNLREWRHFFKQRTSPAAHPQMREIAVPMLADMAKAIPVVFDDLLP